MSNLLNNYVANLRLLDDDNSGDMKDGWKENEIEGAGGPKDPADVELFPIEKADLFLNNLEKPVEIADSWITPYRKRWIEHTSGKNPITDPVYRKELQDIILYPERTGLGPV